MLNEFKKNKRNYPTAPIAKSSVIALPSATEIVKFGKNSHQSFNGHVTGCECKLCTTARAASGGKGPVQDGWESLDGEVEGPVQANKFDKALQAGLEAMNNEGPIQRTIREAREVSRRVPRWPDGGMNMPSDPSKVIYPREEEPKSKDNQKIHSVSLSEDFDRTSIDRPITSVDEDPIDDQNNWGDIEDVMGSVESEEVKYGPGNYPDDNTKPRMPEYYHNLVEDEKTEYKWILPGIIAVGPHPIYTSHLTDLSSFRKAGIKAIVTTFDKPLDPKYVNGFHYHFAPTLDGYSSDLIAICRFIDTQLNLGNPVFIHSLNGKGRAATAMAAYFVHRTWLVAEEAIEWMRENYHTAAVETTAQEDAVLKFAIDT